MNTWFEDGSPWMEIEVDGVMQRRRAAVEVLSNDIRGNPVHTQLYPELQEGEELVEYIGVPPILITTGR